MNNAVHLLNTTVRRSRPWRARLAPCVLAAILAVPGAAHPFSLDALLGMPLERLLQLQVAPRRAALGDGPNAPVAQALLADTRQHHEV